MEYLLLIALAVFVWRIRDGQKELQRRIELIDLGQSALRDAINGLRGAAGSAPGQPRQPKTQPPSAAQPPAKTLPPSQAEPRAPIVPEPPRTPVAITVPAITSTAPPAGTSPSERSLEEEIGAGWSVWVGGLALALGGLLLVRYSIEQGLVGPHVRVAMGALLALALAGAGEYLRRSERDLALPVVPRAHIPSVLTSAATIVAFGTAYAAHALYHFLDPAAAFLLLGAIGIGALLAALVHGPAQAGVGLVGSFAAPLLVSSAAPNPWPVVAYLAVVATAAYALARLRQWLWLGAATVAGVVAWGLVLMIPAGTLSSTWATPALAHVLIQAALAAFFLGIEPNAGRPDEEASPDPVAAIGLFALSVLLLIVLDNVEPDVAGFIPHVLIFLGILAATGVLSAPVAVALLLGGFVVLGTMLSWPALAPWPPPRQPFTREIGEFLRLPANISTFLGFAALTSLGLALAAGWRMLRGSKLPAETMGIYAAAATLPPLLVLIVAYLRVTQFDQSIPFALAGVVLGALFAFGAELFIRRAGDQPPPSMNLAVGVLAAAAIAALALALTAALERGYLTVAFALAALGAAYVSTRRDIPALRYAVIALGALVLARVAYDPRIMGASVGSTPIFNWLLYGYGVPAAAFALSASVLRKRNAGDLAVRICDGLAVLFTALLVTYQIRHFLYRGDPLHAGSGHVELGLQATSSLGLSYVLSRLDLARANPVFRIAATIFGVIAGVVALIGLGLAENPLFQRDPVMGRTMLSSLVIGYLIPGLMAALVARTARGVRPEWYVTGIAVLAVLLLFGYVSLEVRHAFQGEILHWQRHTGGGEHWAYSLAWLGLGLIILAYGFWQGSKPARVASAALVVLAVLKVFLFDLSGLSGLWRPLSFISLGIVLIGIGMAYQRLLFPASKPRE